MSTGQPLRARVARLGAVLAAAALLVAGCAVPLPTVEADPPPDGPQPALDEPRLERVLAAVSDALAAGDETGDVTDFGTRVQGPAMHSRRAEYRLAARTADTDEAVEPQVLTTEPQVVAISNEDEWPKRVLVITTIAEGMNTPLLLGMEQDDPRGDYHLYAWVRLLPETTTPPMAAPVEGSPDVPPDAEGLVLSPADTLDAYADLLENDADSEFADTFTEDRFRSLVVEDREAIAESVEDAGEYTEEYSIRQFEPVGMQTADGGAVVIGALRADHVYERTIDDSELTVAGQIAAFAGSESIDVETSLTARYYVTVAFYVPPADADDTTIQVLGAERVLESVDTE